MLESEVWVRPRGRLGWKVVLDGDVDEEFHDGLEIDLLNADIDRG